MTEIKDAIAKNMAKFGAPVLKNESIYDWMNPWAVNHILGAHLSTYGTDSAKTCSWTAPKNPELEEVFVTSAGDSCGDAETQKMLQMRHFSCACGEYKDVTLRYAGEHSEFLIALMQDDKD